MFLSNFFGGGVELEPRALCMVAKHRKFLVMNHLQLQQMGEMGALLRILAFVIYYEKQRLYGNSYRSNNDTWQ